MELGGRHYRAGEIRMNDKLNYIEIVYSEGEAEYSFNLKPLSGQIGRYFYEILSREGEGRSSIGLKEELRRLLGYDAEMELEEGMGSKYGLLVQFDNGRKAYTGTSRLVVTVPEGASKIKWVEIICIEDTISCLLHEVIETEDSFKIGEAGEYITILGYKGINYQRDILAALARIAGIDLDGLKVRFERIGGSGRVDGMIETEIDIMINGVPFKSGDVITIIEVKSTIKGENLEKLCGYAYDELKDHIKLGGYEKVPYGIAIGFSYDPKDILAGEPDAIKIEVYKMSELKK